MARLHKRTTIVLSMRNPDEAFGKPEDRLRAAVASVPLQACRLLARSGHAHCIAQCPFPGARQKTYASIAKPLMKLQRRLQSFHNI
jgi:hypothetical protein